MTASPSASTTDEGPHITWSMVEDGFYVGTCDGEYLGYVDRQEGGDFLACNALSRPIGRYRDLGTAIDALVDALATVREGAR